MNYCVECDRDFDDVDQCSACLFEYGEAVCIGCCDEHEP